jgi:hypothetical protein
MPLTMLRPIQFACLLIAVCFGALAGCQTPSPPPVQSATPEPKRIALPAPAVVNHQQQIRVLLDQANRAIRYDHLTGPTPGSAQDLFRQVLILDPQNEEALRGPEKIAERFVAQALEAANRWQLVQARGQLSRARDIMPNHPSIMPTQKQLDLLALANRKSQKFPRDGLKDEHTETVGQLIALGTEAKGGSCRTTIIAPGDVEGRWMFQKMNEAQGEGRVRANVQIGSPPGVELVCFPD